MTCGVQDKNFAFYMHIQDGGMHAACNQNKSIYFENQLFRCGLTCSRFIYHVDLYIIFNVFSKKTNLIYIAISL
jgi:hypothetical protein